MFYISVLKTSDRPLCYQEENSTLYLLVRFRAPVFNMESSAKMLNVVGAVRSYTFAIVASVIQRKLHVLCTYNHYALNAAKSWLI